MDFKAEQKYILVSPKKLRALVSVVKTKDPLLTLAVLPHYGKRGSTYLLKVIKTAIANAKQGGVSDKDLVIKEIQINEGPKLKRGRAGARGRLKPYVRKMSHIKVLLTTKDASEGKPEKASGKEKSKKQVSESKVKKPKDSGKVKKTNKKK